MMSSAHAIPILMIGPGTCIAGVEDQDAHEGTLRIRPCGHPAAELGANLTHLLRGHVTRCYCTEHGGEQRAIDEIGRDWLYVAPPVVGDAEAVLQAGCHGLRTPDAYVVLRQEHGRWLAWLGLGTMMRQVRMHEQPLRDAQGRVRMRNGRPRGVMAADTRAEAMANALAAWRDRVESSVRLIREERGGTLEWGVPVEPREAPIVIDASGGNGWDIANELPREARAGLGAFFGLRPSGEAL